MTTDTVTSFGRKSLCKRRRDWRTFWPGCLWVCPNNCFVPESSRELLPSAHAAWKAGYARTPQLKAGVSTGVHAEIAS